MVSKKMGACDGSSAQNRETCSKMVLDRPAINGRPPELLSAQIAGYGLPPETVEIQASDAARKGAVANWKANPEHMENITNPSYKSFDCGTKNNLSAPIFSTEVNRTIKSSRNLDARIGSSVSSITCPTISTHLLTDTISTSSYWSGPQTSMMRENGHCFDG